LVEEEVTVTRGGTGGTSEDLVARYLASARAAGVEAEQLTVPQARERLEELLAEERIKAAALPAAGWTGSLRRMVAEALHRLGCELVAPLPVGEGYRWDRASLDRARLGLTCCPAYLADTGSLVFPSGAGSGGLASALPEVHLALSAPDTCFRDLGAYLANQARMPARLVLITGPSRTGDIEGTMSAGVHGPRRVLHWILEED
jgi:L-lactate dehydrogenase complex protein LldF